MTPPTRSGPPKILAIATLCLWLGLAGCAEERKIDPRSPQLFASFAASLEREPYQHSSKTLIADLIRAGRYKEAEDHLRLLVDGAPSTPLKFAILSTSSNNIEFRGWEKALRWVTPEFEAEEQARFEGLRASEIARAAKENREPLLPEFEPTTAIGLDVSGHVLSNLTRGDEWMAFEVSFYSDKPFGFSTASRAEILEASERYGHPWQGEFVDIATMVEVSGLTELMLELGPPFSNQKTMSVEAKATRSLGAWWALLMLDQALAREVGSLGPDRPLAILLGTHDYFESMVSAHRTPS